MAKADNPPSGRKQPDLNVHELWRPVSDFPGLSQAGVRKKNSRAGKASILAKTPRIMARHAEVLRLTKELETPTISRENLAAKIQSKLPQAMRLGDSQIKKIMRRSKKQPTG